MTYNSLGQVNISTENIRHAHGHPFPTSSHKGDCSSYLNNCYFFYIYIRHNYITNLTRIISTNRSFKLLHVRYNNILFYFLFNDLSRIQSDLSIPFYFLFNYLSSIQLDYSKHISNKNPNGFFADQENRICHIVHAMTKWNNWWIYF